MLTAFESSHGRSFDGGQALVEVEGLGCGLIERAGTMMTTRP